MTNKRNTIMLLMAVAVVLLASTSAFALDMEYRVYGGFIPVVMSLKRVALIFSDNAYSSLLFVFATMGLFFAGAVTYFKIFMGGKMGMLSWAWPVGIGLVLYLATIVPKGNLIITDPVLNKFEVVGNMPNGIVAVAGSLSAFEEIFVKIVETSGNVMRDSDMGFSLVSTTTKLPHVLPNTYMQQNLNTYIADCVAFEMIRPGTDLDRDALMNHSTDLADQLSKAANPGISTTKVTATDKAGIATNCQDLWTSLYLYINDPNVLKMPAQGVCQKNGYSMNNLSDVATCQDRFKKTLSSATGASFDIGQTEMQYAMAQATSEVLGSGDDVTTANFMANRSMVSSMMGMGLVVNEWLPIMRGIITAIAFGLIPFLVLFIPTPMFGKAIGTVIGLFLWLTCWKITDAIVVGLASDFAVNQFAPTVAFGSGLSFGPGGTFGFSGGTSGTAGLGVMGMAMMQTSADKALAMFGYMRTVSIMLATVISSMLVKFGGHAMGMMAGNMQGQMQGAGGQAGAVVGTPEGRTGAEVQVRNAMGNTLKFAKTTAQEEARGYADEGIAKVKGTNQAIDSAGGDDKYIAGKTSSTGFKALSDATFGSEMEKRMPGGMAGALEGAQKGGEAAGKIKENQAIGGPDRLEKMAAYDVEKKNVDMIDRENLLKMMGQEPTVENLAELEKAAKAGVKNATLTGPMASWLNKQKGVDGFYNAGDQVTMGWDAQSGKVTVSGKAGLSRTEDNGDAHRNNKVDENKVVKDSSSTTDSSKTDKDNTVHEKKDIFDESTKVDTSNKTDRSTKVDKSNKTDVSKGYDGSTKVDTSNKTDRSTKVDKSNKTDVSKGYDGSTKYDTSDKVDKGSSRNTARVVTAGKKISTTNIEEAGNRKDYRNMFLSGENKDTSNNTTSGDKETRSVDVTNVQMGPSVSGAMSNMLQETIGKEGAIRVLEGRDGLHSGASLLGDISSYFTAPAGIAGALGKGKDARAERLGQGTPDPGGFVGPQQPTGQQLRNDGVPDRVAEGIEKLEHQPGGAGKAGEYADMARNKAAQKPMGKNPTPQQKKAAKSTFKRMERLKPHSNAPKREQDLHQELENFVLRGNPRKGSKIPGPRPGETFKPKSGPKGGFGGGKGGGRGGGRGIKI